MPYAVCSILLGVRNYFQATLDASREHVRTVGAETIKKYFLSYVGKKEIEDHSDGAYADLEDKLGLLSVWLGVSLRSYRIDSPTRPTVPNH